MRWTKRRAMMARGCACLACMMLVFLSEFAGSAAEDKRLSIYSSIAGFSVQVVDRNGHEYAPLLEILKPLGNVESKPDKHRLKLRFNNVDGEFNNGKTQARIAGNKFDLSDKFLIEEQQ